MNTTTSPRARRRTARRLAVAGVAGALLLVVGASPAGADTSQATATALRIAGTPFPATVSASNDGTQPTVTSGSGTPSALPANPALGAGALAQTASAGSDGTSVACAGLIAPSSAITIAPNGTCSPGSANSGVTLNLASTLVLNAGAITAECTASSTGAPTGRARLANANVTLAGLPLLTLASNPAPNTVTGLSGILDVTTNAQTTNPDGSITVTALSVNVVGQGLIQVGQVTCGPNVVTGAIPLVPAEGLPIAGAVLAASAGALVLIRRQRRSVTVA